MATVTPEAGASFSVFNFISFLDTLITDSDIAGPRSSTSFTKEWYDPAYGNLSGVVSGTGFSYVDTGVEILLASGTITGVTGSIDGVLQGTISDFTLPFAVLAEAIASEVDEGGSDPHAIEKLLLSFDWNYTSSGVSESAAEGSFFGEDGCLFNPIGNDVLVFGDLGNVFFPVTEMIMSRLEVAMTHCKAETATTRSPPATAQMRWMAARVRTPWTCPVRSMPRP